MTTDTQIAREAAERIHLNNEMIRGGHDSPHTTESIILAAINRAREVGTDKLLKEICECAVSIQRNIDDDMGGIPADDIWLTTIHAHAHVIEEDVLQLLASATPSAPTAEKENEG